MSVTPSPPSMPNLGNSCWLNSTMQLVRCCTNFSKRVVRPRKLRRFFKDYGDETEMQQATTNFIESIHELVGFEQQDAHEYLVIFLQNLAEESDHAELVDECFRSTLQTSLTCKGCAKHTVVANKDDMHEYCLNVNVMNSLEEAIQSSMTYRVEKDCDACGIKCGEHLACRKVLVVPKYLIIRANRIQFFPARKVTKHMKSSYLISFGDATMALKGFVIHTGDALGGHFISVVRRKKSWFLCNDENVRLISYPRMLRMLPRAYLLCYRRR